MHSHKRKLRASFLQQQSNGMGMRPNWVQLEHEHEHENTKNQI